MEFKDKILAIATELRQMFGCNYGGCRETSVILVALLRKAGLKAKLMKGTFLTDIPADYDCTVEDLRAIHWWVMCEGFLVDITADQFNDELEDDEMPAIVCIERKGWLRYSKGRIDAKTLRNVSPYQALKEIRGFLWKVTTIREDLKSLGL